MAVVGMSWDTAILQSDTEEKQLMGVGWEHREVQCEGGVSGRCFGRNGGLGAALLVSVVDGSYRSWFVALQRRDRGEKGGEGKADEVSLHTEVCCPLCSLQHMAKALELTKRKRKRHPLKKQAGKVPHTLSGSRFLRLNVRHATFDWWHCEMSAHLTLYLWTTKGDDRFIPSTHTVCMCITLFYLELQLICHCYTAQLREVWLQTLKKCNFSATALAQKAKGPASFSTVVWVFHSYTFWTLSVIKLPASKWLESQSYRLCRWASPLMFQGAQLKCLHMHAPSSKGMRAGCGDTFLATSTAPMDQDSRTLMYTQFQQLTALCMSCFDVILLLCASDFCMACVPVESVNRLVRKTWHPVMCRIEAKVSLNQPTRNLRK